jgi:hypothetical protein
VSTQQPPGPIDADRALDDLLDAAAASPDDEPHHRADFAAVLARAHRIDPTAMPARPSVDAAGRTAPRRADVDRVLASLVFAARDEAERDVAAEATRAPGLPRIGAPRSIRTTTAAIALLSAAAAAVLAFGVLDVGQLARRDVSVDGKSQSAAQLDAEDELRAAHETTGAEPASPAARSARSPAAHLDHDDARGDAPDPEASAIPDEAAPLEPPAAPLPPPTTSVPPSLSTPHVHAPARPRVDPAERLRRLDEEAQAQLAAGELQAAAVTLHEIVRRAGRASIAQLAYGDLFTLAHRRGDEKGQRALWRAYLTKFPRGRFADDARAGLCRHASATDRGACWRSYLEDFPRGAYRNQATRALDDPGAGP